MEARLRPPEESCPGQMRYAKVEFERVHSCSYSLEKEGLYKQEESWGRKGKGGGVEEKIMDVSCTIAIYKCF